MGSIGKSFTLILILIMAISSLSLLMAKPVYAQSIPKPSVPEFSLTFVDKSRDVPPTYEISPLTGKNVTKEEGYHVEDRTIEVSIKNQAFAPQKDASGNYTSLYYILKFKGHYEDNWRYIPTRPFQGNSPPTSPFQSDARGSAYINASQTDFTVISIHLDQFYSNVPNDSQVDVQVQSLIGHDNRQDWGDGYTTYYFEGESSDWSNTQTITILASSTSTSPNPTPTPTVPEFPAVIIVTITVIVLALAISVFKRARAKRFAR